MKRLIYILIACLAVCGTVQAQKTVKQLEKERKQLEKDLEQTSQMLKQTNKNKTATVNKINLLNNDIRTRKRLIKGLNSEITALDNEMQQLGAEKGRLQLQLDSLKADYVELIRKTHYADMQNQPLLFVLSADNFQQMYRRIRYMQEFAAYRKTQVAAIEKTQADIDTKNQELQTNRNSKQNVLKTRKREQDNLARDERKQQQMLKNLKKKEKELIAQQKKQQKKADALNKQIDKLIQEEIRKSKQKLTEEQQLVAGGFAKNKGRLPWPTEKGFISGQFGVHPHPTLAHVTVNNRGVYIQTTAGADARAVYEGVVSAIFVSDGKNVVIVQHGNYRTVYSNLTTLYVRQGDKLQTKQKIGKIYTDPDEDNKTEIFFQVRKDTDVLNPADWIQKK